MNEVMIGGVGWVRCRFKMRKSKRNTGRQIRARGWTFQSRALKGSRMANFGILSHDDIYLHVRTHIRDEKLWKKTNTYIYLLYKKFVTRIEN